MRKSTANTTPATAPVMAITEAVTGTQTVSQYLAEKKSKEFRGETVSNLAVLICKGNVPDGVTAHEMQEARALLASIGIADPNPTLICTVFGGASL